MEVVKVNTDALGLSKAYLTLFNGSLKLTERELDLFSLLLDKYTEFREQGLNEPFLSKFVFSTETKKDVQKSMNINAQYFQNIISGLVKKGCLGAQGHGLYQINTSLIPRREIGFSFG